MGPAAPARLPVAIVYATAILQGMTMVAFPASATVFKEVAGFSDAQYGLIFIPQIVAAIIGSLAGGALARSAGLKSLLAATLVATALSQTGLLLAVEVLAGNGAFYLVLGSTAMFGLAFGVGAAPLNTYPGLLFPGKSDTALVALHTLLGAGLALGPLLVGPFTRAGLWLAYPALLIGASALLAGLLPWSRPPRYRAGGEAGATERVAAAERPWRSGVLWGFVVIVILYAFAEGTFANWSIVFLHEERGIALTQASLALSVFWATLAGGRLLTTLALLKVKAEWIWLSLPVLMIAAFLLIPQATGAAAGIGLFALAGLACSAFFPLSVGLVSKRFPDSTALVSSVMIAALMSGVGVGSFVIGPLRSALPLESLYRYSAAYPAAALALALGVVAYRRLREGAGPQTCRQVLGRPC